MTRSGTPWWRLLCVGVAMAIRDRCRRAACAWSRRTLGQTLYAPRIMFGRRRLSRFSDPDDQSSTPLRV